MRVLVDHHPFELRPRPGNQEIIRVIGFDVVNPGNQKTLEISHKNLLEYYDRGWRTASLEAGGKPFRVDLNSQGP